MKIIFRITSLILVLLMLSSLWGCSLPGIGDESGEATSERATTTLPPEDIAVEDTTSVEGIPYETETEYLGPFTEPVPETTHALDLPNLDYDGEPVRILYGSDAKRNEFDADISGEIIDDAVFARNMTVEDLLDVKLEWKGVASNASHATEYVRYAETMHAAGEPCYIYAATRRAMSQMLMNDLLLSLTSVENLFIDLSKPWYPETLNKDLSIEGTCFYITGDISVNTLLQMNAIFYNKAVAKRFERPIFEDLVREGRWTLDALIENSKGVYIDEDASGTKTGGDMYGFTQATYFDTDAFYFGSGLSFFKADPTNEYYVIASYEDIASAKSDTLAQKLYDFFNSPSSYVGSPAASSYDYTLPFSTGLALFCHGTLSLTDRNGALSKLTDTYGILPIPKFDTEQETYFTTLSNKAIFWGFNRLLYPETESMITAVTEVMAYEGYTRVAEAVFESVMKQRYAPISDSGEMYDLIRASVRVDIGKLFAEELGHSPAGFASSVTSSPTEWKLTVMTANSRAQFERIAKAFNNKLTHVYVFEEPLQ